MHMNDTGEPTESGGRTISAEARLPLCLPLEGGRRLGTARLTFQIEIHMDEIYFCMFRGSEYVCTLINVFYTILFMRLSVLRETFKANKNTKEEF